MEDTLGFAIIAVAGTVFGAAISPLINLFKEVLVIRSGTKSDRIKEAAVFGVALLKLARASASLAPNALENARREAIAQRFEVARIIPKGAGNVDRFAEAAIKQVDGWSDENRRVKAAEFAASRILDWARGDLAPSKLTQFEVVLDGSGGYDIV